MRTRPWRFKWRQCEPEVILCAVRWYLRSSLSYRDVQELLAERGIMVDHSTIWRWVQRSAPEMAVRQQQHLKSTNKSWRVDETYLKVKGPWTYLYRAVDSTGATVDFFLAPHRDTEAALSLFRRALRHGAPAPRVINTDLAPTYPAAIAGLQRSGNLPRRCRHRPVQYLNNIVEQDHRFVKKRIVPKQGFRAFGSARRALDGAEAVHRRRKGQVRWRPSRDIARHDLDNDRLFGLVRCPHLNLPG
jgi:transposase-like protein